MKVKFLPSEEEYEIKNNETVLHLAHNNGIHIQSVCKGIPSCAECRVKIVEGEHNVIQPTSTEKSLIGTSYFIDNRRLSCQLRCFGDITIDLTEQIEKEERAAKKPRGRVTRDEDLDQESHAVMGSLVLGEEFDLQNFEDDEELDLPEEAKKQKKAQTGGFYDALEKIGNEERKKKKNNRRRRPKGGQKKTEAKSGGEGKSSGSSQGNQGQRRRRRKKKKRPNQDGQSK